MRRSHASLALALAVLPCCAAWAAPRTFVASYGTDANACTVVSPCRSFARAISQTDTGGEVIVLDSAGYGTVSITRSVSIIAPPGVYAGITASSAQGVYINSGTVVLRGLSITGQGSNPDISGVFVFDATEVHIENCVISGAPDSGVQVFPFLGQPKVYIKDTVVRSNGSLGIYVANGDAGELHVSDTVISHNGYAPKNVPAGVSVLAGNATFDHVRIESNAGDGLEIRDYPGSAVRTMTIRDSVVSGNGAAGVLINTSGGSFALLAIDQSLVERNGGEGVVTEGGGEVRAAISRSTLTNNSADGIAAHGSAAMMVVVSDNTLTRNAICGLGNYSAGILASRGNNTIADNGCTTSGTITPLTGH